MANSAHRVVKLEENEDVEDEFQRGNAPLKYVPLREVYSATQPEKVEDDAGIKPSTSAPHDQSSSDELIVQSKAYLRRWRKRERANSTTADVQLAEEGGMLKKIKIEVSDGEFSKPEGSKKNCRKKISKTIHNSGSSVGSASKNRKRKRNSSSSNSKKLEDDETKKWMWLCFEDVDPMKFIGLTCKVFWPLDAIWYSGNVVGYNYKSGRHQVKYEDGEEENLFFSKERIKFHISFKEMQKLKLKCRENNSEADKVDLDEIVVLAASLDDGVGIEPGELVWAKLTGHAIWPAIVLDKSHVPDHKGLNKNSGEESVLVQFFGTHDFASVKHKNVVPFLKGLISSCHSKCKKPAFVRGMEEAKTYLSENKLPERMLLLRDGNETYNNGIGSEEHDIGADLDGEECLSHDEIRKKLEDLKNCPLEAGELQVISLGKIVKDSDYFQNGRFIWPEGYTAVRKFPSITDPGVDVLYKMEVLRDVDSRTRPLFIVTTDNGEEFKGSTPSACWSKIYKRLRAMQINHRDYKTRQNFESGSYMFGFSHSKVSKLIKEMSNSKSSLLSSELSSRRDKNKSIGYRAVYVEWKDLDKCNVCHMDDEYENNLFLQCDKCRMMVHAKCYGELEPSGGELWLCNLCRPGAPETPPRCCICPIVGGAMKPTTNGHWAHLACAIWIPETCLADIKKMEPIDGVRKINKDRWKLLCSICGVFYGACIQCSNNTCRVAYHPLCARVAGFCLEVEGVDKLRMLPSCEDEEDQCIQLLSYCRKHMSSSKERLSSEERFGQRAHDSAPQPNPSGCARAEPYNYSRMRGRNEPEALAAASAKRLYMEKQPYLVAGCSPNMPLWNKMSNSDQYCKYSVDFQKLQNSLGDTSSKILSVADKYNDMKETFRQRLAFGKSDIHGYGVFAKLPHRAGDMVIEYTGEVIRRTVADRREHLMYNKLVGAGTYMFGINDEHVIDATRSGSIAQLINHSCEPNCHSIVKAIDGVDHIIIFAKREIKQWEELTYDYRFASTDERLACHCGSSRCRGVVNNEEQKQLYVPRSELIDWDGE